MTLEFNTNHETPTPSRVESENESAEIIDDDVRAFARRIFQIYENTMSQNERLSALYVVDRAQFEIEVDESVEVHVAEDPDYQILFDEFQKVRRNGGGDSYVSEIKARHSKARELIMSTLNLPENSKELGIEESKKNIEDLLKDIPKEPANLDLALSVLGAKVKVDDAPGEYIYSYPYDLLPEKVNNKWVDYLDTVKEQLAVTQIVTPETVNDVKRIDLNRKLAHDSVTRSVYSIMQLSQFGLDEKQTRAILAKMRNDELMLEKKQHKSVHNKTPEEIAVARQLSRHSYHH